MALRYQGTIWGSTNTDISTDVVVGDFSSSTAKTGLPVNASRTKVLDVCADDGGDVLAVGSAVRAVRQRLLLTATHTGNVSAFGGQRQVKITGDVSGVTGNIAGGWDLLEGSAAASVGVAAAATYSMVDFPAGSVIAASGILAGHQIGAYSLGGTHTGKAACINMPNPANGTWDYGMIFGDTTGATAANTHTIDSHALAFIIKVRVGDVDGFIPVLAAVPA
jgi:hypothetical protein